jgi:hypothetical protein
MPIIIRAEYLSYYNQARNSDKLFNIFLIQEDDGTFSCLTENGRRGSNLVSRTLCSKTGRATAESKFRQKHDDKRYHRDTPYKDEAFGANYSQIAGEYSSNQSQSGSVSANQMSQPTPVNNVAQPSNRNIIEFPAQKKEKPRQQPKQSGILNQEQFDSLEI